MILHVSYTVIDCDDLDIGCACVHNDGNTKAEFCQMTLGWTSIEFIDDGDEQIRQCLQQVRLFDLL
jgi:hypothetical protein